MQYHVRTRILIIDDEPDITFGFKKVLRDKGFEQVETANDPIFALKDFKAGSYDLPSAFPHHQ
jgi:DNA-binding response OmpR family regulator